MESCFNAVGTRALCGNKGRRERQADKVLAAVNERLIKEINYWSDRYIKLSDDVAADKQPRMQPELARRRVDELTAGHGATQSWLNALKNVVSSTPVVIGGALVIPQGVLALSQRETQFSVGCRSKIQDQANCYECCDGSGAQPGF